ncbi:DUF3502 domain-containing protein [Caldicellulosiruptoraceae bacterium PP1]
MKKVKAISLILTVCFVISILGSSVFASSKKVAPGFDASIDISKPVKLTGYLLGDAPAGMPEVMKKLNEKLKKDINATMEINYIGWGDLNYKYPLVLASGENVDWIYTANWAFYAQEAIKGGFKALTTDMLKKYMPRHYKVMPQAGWKQALIKGKVYMIPTATPDRKSSCLIIREDLRQKYGVPEIKRYTDIEPYLAAIKKNEPTMTPMNLDSQYDTGNAYWYLIYESGEYLQDAARVTSGGTGLYTSIYATKPEVYYIMDNKVFPRFKKAAQTIKSWYDKGYINKNAFANKVRSKDSFDQGKSAVGFGNTQDIQSNLANAKAKGWKVKVIPVVDAKGHYPADPYLNNGVALVAKTKNAERALMALDLIMEEKSYNYLVYFGIEGKNYIVKNGKIDLPAGVTADKNTYPPDAAGFWFTNKDQHLPLASWDSDYIALREKVKKSLYNDMLAAFSLDQTNIKTEIANLNQVIVQYMTPIQIGIVKDVDSAFATLDKKLKAAGVEKVKKEVLKQIGQYMDSIK